MPKEIRVSSKVQAEKVLSIPAQLEAIANRKDGDYPFKKLYTKLKKLWNLPTPKLLLGLDNMVCFYYLQILSNVFTLDNRNLGSLIYQLLHVSFFSIYIIFYTHYTLLS